jgi:hypothetical protein
MEALLAHLTRYLKKQDLIALFVDTRDFREFPYCIKFLAPFNFFTMKRN